MTERWLPVVGWEEAYEVSNLGNLRRTKSLKANRVGVLLKGSTNRDGYRIFHLRDGTRNKSRTAHRLVAEAFIPNPDNLPLVLHGPNRQGDNSVGNLRWGTNSDNMKDRRRDGTDYELNKTHCPKGHPYSPENTYWSDAEKRARKCKTCHNSRRWKGSEPDYNPIRNVKLSEEDVRKIRTLVAEGLNDPEIAGRFQVSISTVRFIRIGKTWAHVE